MKKRILAFMLLFIMFLLSCDKAITIMSGIKNDKELTTDDPVQFALGSNTPNPFENTTNITYCVSTTMHLTLTVYTEDWQEVKTLVKEIHQPGYYSIKFAAYNKDNELLPSGDYFYTLKGKGFVQARQMKLVK